MAVTNKGGTPILGLDIGTAFIKAVELRPSRGALVVSGVGVLPTPPGCIVNDEIVDPATLAAAVKQCLAENNIKTKQVMASVAGQSSVVVRVIEVPSMTDKELAETMKWEIDRHIPFAPEEVVKDFKAISVPGPDAANMSVLLAVAQNAVVSGMMATIQKAGLTPVAIDVEMLASARAMIDVDDDLASQTVALVNIGSSKVDVGVYEKGSLAFPRTIPVAGHAMAEAVATKMSVSLADAERLIKQHGFVPADAAKRFGSEALQAQEEDQFQFGEFGGDIDFSAPLSASSEPTLGPVETQAAPSFGSEFASTTEGPVFDVPTFGTAPSFGVPEPAPEFGSGPTFQLPDMGPSNLGQPEEAPAIEPEPEAEVPAQPEPEPVAASVPEVLSEAEKNRREISDAFMPVVAEIVTEVKRSVEYYTTRADNARIDRVVVFGGVSKLPGLNSFMEAELGVPVQTAGLPRAISVSGKAVTPDYLTQVASLLPVAIGLAARTAIAGPPAPPKSGKAKKGE